MSDIYADVSTNSRLRFSRPTLGTDGVNYWDLWSLTAHTASQPDDITYTVTGTDTIPNIATQMYGDPVLWWAVALANDIVDPLMEVYEGRELRILSQAYLDTLFATKAF